VDMTREQMRRHDEVLALCDAHGHLVRTLALELGAAGVALPVTRAMMDRLVASKAVDSAAAYMRCAEVMTGNDMSAVWSILRHQRSA